MLEFAVNLEVPDRPPYRQVPALIPTIPVAIHVSPLLSVPDSPNLWGWGGVALALGAHMSFVSVAQVPLPLFFRFVLPVE